MTNTGSSSRREFLRSAATLTSAAYLRLTSVALVAITETACTAKQEASPFKVLRDQEAADFTAIAARLIPTTDTPGATEAGVIYFFDSAFADSMSESLAGARTGLAAFNAALAEAHPDSTAFADLSAENQDAFLRTQESSDFFNLLRTMTIFGFFSMQQYGGNKHHIGWNMIGFEGDHGPWQYPFGYYDAQVNGETADGE